MYLFKMYYNIIIDNIESFPDNISSEEWELKVMVNVDKYINKYSLCFISGWISSKNVNNFNSIDLS